jgi:hypothetical protein
MLPRDTTAEAQEVQRAVFRSMTSEQRVRIAIELSDQVMALAAAGIRARHPDYGDAEVEWAIKRLRIGDELFRQAWPDAPLFDA